MRPGVAVKDVRGSSSPMWSSPGDEFDQRGHRAAQRRPHVATFGSWLRRRCRQSSLPREFWSDRSLRNSTVVTGVSRDTARAATGIDHRIVHESRSRSRWDQRRPARGTDQRGRGQRSAWRLPRSSFHEWRTRPLSDHYLVDAASANTTDDIHVASDLWGAGTDRLNRDFTAERSDQRWVADVSEFRCLDGKLFLAGIRDLHDRGLAAGRWATATTPPRSSPPSSWPSLAARVLETDRDGDHERGRRCSPGVPGGRLALVSPWWRNVVDGSERTRRPLSVVRGTRGNRTVASEERASVSERSLARSIGRRRRCLASCAAQRRDQGRQAGMLGIMLHSGRPI